jgi:peptidoglycan/LPS O-acetylase OafA/YrhL
MSSLAAPDRNRRFAYLPSLDGWRAVAILSVILYHSNLHRAGIFSTWLAWRFGYRGVDVFFAISGLLITSKLLEEEQRSGRISLPNFYLRRAFRILPPALLYLFIIAGLDKLRLIYIYAGEWFASLFFYRNYTSLFHIERALQLPWFTTHFWSLSIEEHFYFLLPSLLLFTRGKARIFTLGVISLCVIAHRQLELTHRSWFTIQFHTDVRLDALMIPALFAVLSRSEVYGERFNSFIRKWHFAFILACLFFVWWAEGSGLQQTAIGFVMPGVVLGTVLKPKSLVTQILEWSPLRWIGRISYSLYLWQELFFTQRFLERRPLGHLQAWPLNLVLTFLVAACSYYGVERPLVRLGHRLTRSRVNSSVEVGEPHTPGAAV